MNNVCLMLQKQVRFFSLFLQHSQKSVPVKKKFQFPQQPYKSRIDPSKLPPQTRIDASTIALLERLSLVDCANKQGIETLEEAIAFADQILQIDTKNVEPLVSVLEDIPLSTREDIVNEGNCREDILRNAQITEEEYFVAPPGNIPLEARFLKSTNSHSFKLGPLGALLQHNLYTEWFNNIVINKFMQVFPNIDELNETFNFGKSMCLDVVPFGVTKCTPRNFVDDKFEDDGAIDFRRFFNNDLELECCIFESPTNANQFFYQWQKERKIWWRKFSASPGRYVLTDIKTNPDRSQSVEIRAKYPWGEQLVESLSLVNELDLIPKEQLMIKEGRKKAVQSQCVISRISLSVMLLNYLCDTYDEPSFHNQPRPLFRFHRKLAPYRISFAMSTAPKQITDQLKDLALHLCRQLRNNNNSCLYTPMSYKATLESQWQQYDQMGIPYNLLINEGTLKTGIGYLRSRDTTLKEEIHVVDLPAYVEKLFRNY